MRNDNLLGKDFYMVLESTSAHIFYVFRSIAYIIKKIKVIQAHIWH